MWSGALFSFRRLRTAKKSCVRAKRPGGLPPGTVFNGKIVGQDSFSHTSPTSPKKKEKEKLKMKCKRIRPTVYFSKKQFAPVQVFTHDVFFFGLVKER